MRENQKSDYQGLRTWVRRWPHLGLAVAIAVLPIHFVYEIPKAIGEGLDAGLDEVKTIWGYLHAK